MTLFIALQLQKTVAQVGTNQGNLLDTIADSNQVLSVISDAGDHVLKLSFMDSSPLNQSTFSTKRYTYN